MTNPFEALFEAVRDIPAIDAAERLNIQLRMHGQRAVACCPMHGESKPSLTFYPDGHFYCFGCNAHGRAIELYQQVLKLSPLEAARCLAVDFNIPEPMRGAPVPPRAPTAYDLKRVLDNVKSKHLHVLCERKHAAIARAAEISDTLKDHAKCAESRLFWAAIKDAASAEVGLYQLEDASPADLLALAKGAVSYANV